jgi:hypothetical protein
MTADGKERILWLEFRITIEENDIRHREGDYILVSIDKASVVMAFLYGNVPVMADTPEECFSYLGRHRIAIEDDSISNSEAWTSVPKQ